MTDGVPTASGWMFYIAQVVTVFGYITIIAVIVRRRGLAHSVRWPTLLASLAFFLLCAAIHIELALHVFFNARLVNDDGTVDGHMQVVTALKAASVWAILLAASSEAASRPSREKSTAPESEL